MPQLGVGILPGGALGNELVAVTRRAFIPRLVVQLYKATPMLSLLLRNAQRAKGGASQVTAPLQGGSFVNFSWSDYSGSFPQPAVQTAVQNAEWNLKLGVVPIPFLGMESIVQSSEVVFPLLKARMADAKTVALQSISAALFTNNAATPTIVDSLLQAYDNGNTVPVYGGVNRTVAANQFWQSTVITGAGASSTRVKTIPFLVQTTALAGGEAPDFAIMNPGDWTTLMTDFMGAEQFHTTPSTRYEADDLINAGFRGLMLADVPIFMDLWCPQGTMYIFNSRYLALYMSEDAPFAFSGFYSSIPNLQIANIGVVIVAFDVCVTKPSSGMRVTGITGNAF